MVVIAVMVTVEEVMAVAAKFNLHVAVATVVIAICSQVVIFGPAKLLRILQSIPQKSLVVDIATLLALSGELILLYMGILLIDACFKAIFNRSR